MGWIAQSYNLTILIAILVIYDLIYNRNSFIRGQMVRIYDLSNNFDNHECNILFILDMHFARKLIWFFLYSPFYSRIFNLEEIIDLVLKKLQLTQSNSTEMKYLNLLIPKNCVFISISSIHLY